MSIGTNRRTQSVWLALAVASWAAVGCAAQDDAAAPPCGEGESLHSGTCRPADAALRPLVKSAALGPLRLDGAAQDRILLGHPLVASLPLELDGQALDTSVAVRAASTARQAECKLGYLPVHHSGQQAGPNSSASHSKSLQLTATLTVPEACRALVGATDVRFYTVFDPHQTTYMPARDNHLPGHAGAAQDPTLVGQFEKCGVGSVLRSSGCGAAIFAESAGIDVQLRKLTMVSSVGVLEYAGEPLKPVAARPALTRRNNAGEVVQGVPVAEVVPSEQAPTLADTPVVAATVAVNVYGAGPSGNAAPGDLHITLAMRPVGLADAPWEPIEHHAVAATAEQAPVRSLVLPVEPKAAVKGAGLELQAALPAAVRDRVTVGDWKDAKLFELQACLKTATQEAGTMADARQNNCQSGQFVLVRVQKNSGVHVYPLLPTGPSNSTTKDYYELGKTVKHGMNNPLVFAVKVFRGAYREVENGHVRLGAKTWANLLFFDTIETGHVVEAGAYHDTAPAADDFVSGFLTILSAYTIDLPKYTVPEKFKFALNAAVDVKNSQANFGGTANLGPLVDALNFVAQQATANGLKWCFFDVACIEPPLTAPVSLKLGLALAKNTTVPDCDLVAGQGCYRLESNKAGHFWNNASHCAAMTAALASDHATPQGAAAMRSLANKWNTPFYLGLYRPGNDYHYLLSKVFFDKNWAPYGTDMPSTIPTFWAFLDETIEAENGGCAVVAPDATSKFFTTDYTGPTVAASAAQQPWLWDQAARASVGCEAQLPFVCEFPVDGDKVMHEDSQVYVQQTGQIVVNGTVTESKELFNLKASVTMDGYVLKATWAATAGIRWNASLNSKQNWHVKGSNFGSVVVAGQVGEFTVSGEGCVLIGVPEVCIPLIGCTPSIGHWECLSIDLGGLTKLLKTDEVGVGYALDFLPFDVQPK